MKQRQQQIQRLKQRLAAEEHHITTYNVYKK
jgi:hypothetical protein